MDPRKLETLISYIHEDKLVKFYKSREWRELRQVALLRDNNECQMHKAKGKYQRAQCVHHIKEVKPYPHLALTLANLTSLCNNCHNEVHGRVGGQTKQEPFKNEERW